MSDNTKIILKRSSAYTSDTLNDDIDGLEFGEPLLIDTSNTDEPEKYLVLGPAISGQSQNGPSVTEVNKCIFIKGLTKDQAAKAVMYNNDNVITDLAGNPLKVSRIKSSKVHEQPTGDPVYPAEGKYFIVTSFGADEDLYTFDYDNPGIYIDEHGVMHGAAWNDYAESRTCEEEIKPGTVVCEDGHGNVVVSTEKLQPCSYVVSDTFGFTLGSGNINIAIAGKALVYTDDEVELGDCLTAGPNGKAVKMTRQEIINYPDRILGIVTEIPDYLSYNDIEIDGRIWIKVK